MLDPRQMPPGRVVKILHLLARIFPKKGFRKPFDPKLIVSDGDAFRKWERDPLVSRNKITFAYAIEMLRCQSRLPSECASIKVPLLMQWGNGDKVVTLSGHEMMIQASASPDTELKIYKGGFHNLLEEPHLKDNVMGDIQDWIAGHG